MTHHGAGLRKLTGNEELVNALQIDYRSASLEPADRVMLDYVDKLTREPWTMKAEDVEALAGVGFDDGAILDICQVAAYFAFVNRMADGLGVELEDHLRKS